MVVGQTLGHYRIRDKLGAGGMGEVYLAEDSTLKRQVALKVLPPELAANQERLDRFQREAETLAALDHPNITSASDALKYAVVAGAVTGGGLTIIANAPNPAGISLLRKHFVSLM